MRDGAAVNVRVAADRDISAVLALYGQADLDDGRVLSLADARRLLARFAEYPDYTLYVAELDGAVVGSFALLIMDNVGHLGTPSTVAEDVVVAAELRGRGIGSAMMQEAGAIARAKGCYKLLLSSNLKRERAHAFYESLGYERHGYSFRLNLERSEA